MTVDDELLQLRATLEELVGVRGAAFLMDRPQDGWSDLVTNRTLDLRFAAFEKRMDRKLDALEARVDLRFAAVDARFTEVERRFDAVDHRFDAVDHRFDRFEHQLLAQVDRRLRAQAWVTITTVVGAMGVIAALVRL